jgi:hypothetical protein
MEPWQSSPCPSCADDPASWFCSKEEERDPDGVGLAFRANWVDETRTQTTDTGERHLQTGSAAGLAVDIAR